MEVKEGFGEPNHDPARGRCHSALNRTRSVMIRQHNPSKSGAYYTVINADAAQAYDGVIPPDCWKEPYMSKDELRHETDAGVVFWGYEEDGQLLGVMGIQHVQDVTLIRHAYVRTGKQNRGSGDNCYPTFEAKQLARSWFDTWANAIWAIRFYEKHGFRLVSSEEKDRLLRKYWSIHERQIETSVVLADQNPLS